MCVAPVQDGASLGGVIIESKSGRQAVLAKTVIDCSGDGDLAARAGADFQKGNDDGHCQPVTVLFRVAGIDIEAFLTSVEGRPEQHNIVGPHENYLAVALLPAEGEGLVNMALVKSVDATNSADLTRAELAGGDMADPTIRFLRKYIPGFADAHVAEVMPHVGIRESRRIVGEHVLNVEEMGRCERFPDRVFRGARGVGIHDPSPEGAEKCESMHMAFPDGYFVPYRCLVPKALDNLLVAGRCMSVGYRAFGSTRPATPSMLTTQPARVRDPTGCGRLAVAVSGGLTLATRLRCY